LEGWQQDFPHLFGNSRRHPWNSLSDTIFRLRELNALCWTQQYRRTAGEHPSFTEGELYATVTVVHSRTRDIAETVRRADIIIAAIGQPGFITADMVKEGAVVIDVGTTRVDAPETKAGWRLKGDVDFENVAPRCSWITPVPGGVGTMTRLSLLLNTLKACRR
jgi:hypothetical protein